MDLLGEYSFVIASGAQGLAYVALAVVALTRLGNGWAVLALAGALASLVPTVWYAAANVAIRSGEEGGTLAVEFFYTTPAQLLMQALGIIGTLLLVAAVFVGRGPRKQAPVDEGPTGTTFRQLPSSIRWQ